MGMLQMTWQPSLVKRKQGSPPLGLRNLGNTCYLNSVIQCLTYTPPLANFCLRYLHSSVCDFGAGKDRKGECPFCILERRITRSLSSESVADAPIQINSCLRIYAEHFRRGSQEDAHEFLRYVIDACHNTCLRVKKLQKKQRGMNGIANGGDGGGCGETVVKEIFGGTLQSQVKCLSCGAESNKVDEIMDISLDILHSGSLRQALQKYFQPEVLDGSNKYKCDNCKELVVARKQMSILEAPNVLVIQLKRFGGVFGTKIDKSIAFDEILVLSSYLCEGSKDQQPEYDLFGTIVHSGFSPDSGHYYAYIKDAIGRWYCCNDSYVTVTNLQQVLSEKVYILFFSRSKQRSRSRVGPVVNELKTHESNGSKTSMMQNSGSVDGSVCRRKVSNHLQETNKSCGGRPVIQKSGGSEKPFSMKIPANHSKTNRSNNYCASNGTKALACQRFDHVKTPSNMGDHSDNQPEACKITSLGLNSSNSTHGQISSTCLKQGEAKDSLDHHSQTSDSIKSGSDDQLGGQQRNFSESGITNKVLAPENTRIAVQDNESKEETGYTAALPTGVEKERMGLMGDGNSRCSVDSKITERELSSLPLSNGIASTAVNSSQERLPEVNGPALKIDSPKSFNCKDSRNGDIGVSNNSCAKRKMEDDCACRVFTGDDQSRERLESFKELLGKEASMILRSCGWTEDVHSFMHATKKLCQETDNSSLNDHEMKSLLVSQAKRNFISKVPESLKANLVERLKLFSEEKQPSGS